MSISRLLFSIFAISSIFAYDDDTQRMHESVPPGKHHGSSEGDLMCKFNMSYTFWAARQGGLAVSYDTTPSSSDSDDESAMSTVEYPKIDPRSGFKIGAGCIFDHDGWDLMFLYTWFYNKDNTYTQAGAPANGTNTIYATWNIGDSDNKFVSGMDGSAWNIAFNRIDLTLGRSFYAGHYLSLRPFLGMIFAWDDQEFKVSYGYCMNGDSNDGMVTEWRNTQDWYGIGPSLGITPSFIVWMAEDHDNCFSICGNSGAALTWSRANTKMRQFMNTMAIGEDGMPDAEYRDIFLYVTPMVETSLGICWDAIFDGRWAMNASVSWEQQVWFSHNRMFNIANYPSSRGIFSMQGLTINVGAGF